MRDDGQSRVTVGLVEEDELIVDDGVHGPVVVRLARAVVAAGRRRRRLLLTHNKTSCHACRIDSLLLLILARSRSRNSTRCLLLLLLSEQERHTSVVGSVMEEVTPSTVGGNAGRIRHVNHRCRADVMRKKRRRRTRGLMLLLLLLRRREMRLILRLVLPETPCR